LVTVLGWMDGFGIDPSPWPRVTAYMRRIERRPSVAAAMEREAAVPPVTWATCGLALGRTSSTRCLLRLQMFGHEVDERSQFGRNLAACRPENVELISLFHPLVKDGHETAISDSTTDREGRQASNSQTLDCQLNQRVDCRRTHPFGQNNFPLSFRTRKRPGSQLTRAGESVGEGIRDVPDRQGFPVRRTAPDIRVRRRSSV
jgi:hypothetical protein